MVEVVILGLLLLGVLLPVGQGLVQLRHRLVLLVENAHLQLLWIHDVHGIPFVGFLIETNIWTGQRSVRTVPHETHDGTANDDDQWDNGWVLFHILESESPGIVVGITAHGA